MLLLMYWLDSQSIRPEPAGERADHPACDHAAPERAQGAHQQGIARGPRRAGEKGRRPGRDRRLARNEVHGRNS